MEAYLLIDFGSTYTKVTAVDLEGETVLGTAQASTTIETDVRMGLNEALALLEDACGLAAGDYAGKYACSSAAGGLKMVSIGLVPSLTLEAARRAALGAGAKVIGSFGYELTTAQAAEIEGMKCDIIMLAGGTDGGNKDVIRHNAQLLARTDVTCPVLVCGNAAVQDEIADMLESSGKKIYRADNVLPEVDRVCVESAQNVIRDIFVRHITKAKGLEHAAAFVGRDIIPTPKATLNAATLIAQGSKNEAGMGSVLVLEIGGATINVHSVEEVRPVTPQTIMRGLPENKVKRTVEGDLGIRWNANTICELVGANAVADNLSALEPGIDASSIDPAEFTFFLAHNTSHKPQGRVERAFDVALAYSAADVAVRRHAGTARKEAVAIGEVDVQRGKNLLDVRNVIGVGGIFRYGERPERILLAATYDLKHPESLRPVHPDFYLDTTYVLYAVGLLSQDHPDQALRIAKKYLEPARAVPTAATGGYAEREVRHDGLGHAGCGGLMSH